MKRDYEKESIMRPQFNQSDTTPGVMKGLVVDVRDPSKQGRVRVAAYSEDGDYKKLDISTLPWVEPMHPLQGSFSPPQLNGRVWVSFECGDRYAPVYFGHWNASPRGRGGMPQNAREGSEIHPAGWHFRDLYPESIVVASSGPGNVIAIADKFLDKKMLASSISLIDVAGKGIQIRTFHTKPEEYLEKDTHEKKEGSLYKVKMKEGKPTRVGFETTEDLKPQPGTIELGHQRLRTDLIAADGDFTLDQTAQKSDETKVDYDQRAVGGNVWAVRQTSAAIAMALDTIFLSAPNGVIAGQVLSVPERWDQEDEDGENGVSGSGSSQSVSGTKI